MQGPVHPQVRTFARWIRHWGKLKLALLCQLLLSLGLAIVSAVTSVVLNNQVDWELVRGAMLAAAALGPVAIAFLFYLVLHLDAALSYLEDSAHQERLLNEGMQENIRQLNYEIEERKKAFQAKRRAIDELRKEIAERKKAQIELEEQSLLIRSIVDSSPDLFYYRDETGRFASCNKMFEQLMGKSATELIGHYPAEIYSAKSAQAAILTEYEVAMQPSELTLDVEYVKEDGQRLWLEMRKVPFYDRHGRYIGLLGFGRDITSRKLAEQALEKAYQDKGKFIATLSHELRTPLNGIVGLSRRLLESKLTKQQHGWANTIFSSAETLGNIFNDIIDLDKIDRQDLDIVYQSLSLRQFINDIANFAELLCHQKGLAFELHCEGNVELYLRLDPTRLRQVLWNLLNNAVKFTAAGQVALTCKVDTEKSELMFQVSDTGIGIAAKEQQRIFDMYYKSSDGRRLSIIGSGIGLSVSRALVEAMKGTIVLQSELGRGSCFEVRLPAECSEQEAATQISCPELTILLIEDVPLNAEIATGLLEQRGHTVIHAETGEDAMALLETEDDIDLVLLDMQLPDMSGEQIAQFIRQEPRLAALPIVVLSANVRKAEQQLQGLHIDNALAKPINTGKLDAVLAQLFSPSAVKLQKPLLEQKTTESAALDINILNDYLQSLGKDTVKRSAQLFAQLLPGYMNRLMETAVQRQLKEFQEAAHKLKGAAASVGLLWVQQQAKRLEQEEINWQGMERQLVEFHFKTEQHLTALSDYIEKA
ncbi:MAG: PAS domain S-box protein [Gammaproteobacteria bacterium]|nr:PAS domain S-box protein [Gammaproteobacteria bacterium]MBU1556989.1 PAS domain S-box protein [Gammaproteobacteria bacterium]MBU2071127.1 PAS domain S-box protein [Gammaproteobacteria bacterium]MBU2183054.1 PAS domain S-box protein [Gammaproteobacteria bacterium]MBU2203186.1 PAS domain S-box protein [Gammaproteobacteria bacterium]